MTPELAEALAAATTFPEVLAAIHAARYTGQLVLQIHCGLPQHVDVPQAPTRVLVARKRTKSAPVSSPGD